MAEAEKIPKIDPAEVEILIERVKRNKLEEREAELIAGLLRTLLYLVAMLQEKKATLLRLREMIFGRKSEKRKKADPESAKDEEKKDVAGDTDNGAAKDQAGTEKNEKSDSEAQPKRRGRVGHRVVQDRGLPPPWPLAKTRRCRVREARMGRLVRQPPTARTDWRHSAGGV
jgi:hypothetical protein